MLHPIDTDPKPKLKISPKSTDTPNFMKILRKQQKLFNMKQSIGIRNYSGDGRVLVEVTCVTAEIPPGRKVNEMQISRQ
jgi:hypothetical protein